MNGSSELENASLFFAKFTVQKTFIIIPPENPLALADGMNGGLLSSWLFKISDIIYLVLW